MKPLSRSSARPLVLWTVLISLVGLCRSSPQADLPPTYRDWLQKEAAYIITEKEREVFLALRTDRERDIFIEAFWKQRDPTPGTPRNEFKEEHYRRVAHADSVFGRGTSRPGRETERGRIYILLGPPLDTTNFDEASYIQPTQIWSYRGKPELGMPSNFILVFYKRWGASDYELYSPVLDGPASLLVNFRGDPANSSQAYQQLRKFNPVLADASISLIPGETSAFGQPSLASDQLLSKISAIPEKTVDWRYAEALLKFKDIVEVDYSANYIRSEGLVRAVRDRSGTFFVHYSIQPEILSVLNYENAFDVSFDVHGIVSDSGGTVVFQFDRSYPLSFDKDQILDIQKTGVVIQDCFPLVPGDYTFGLLLKNTVSKEFSSFEATLSIPEPGTAPAISPLLLGYNIKEAPGTSDTIKPFRFGDIELSCQAQNIFHPGGSLTVFWQTFNPRPELPAGGKAEFVITRQEGDFRREVVPLADLPQTYVFRSFPLGDFPPDYYTIRVSILNPQERVLVSDEANFVISPVKDIPRPWVVSKVMPSSDHGMYDFILGRQLGIKGDLSGAARSLGKAFESDPRIVDYAIEYARVLIKQKNFTKAEGILSRFSETPGKDFQVLTLLGESSEGLGEYEEAVSYYQRYVSLAGLNFFVLNRLGECYLRLGKIGEALEVWEKSLEINPAQPDLARRIQDLKRKKRLLGRFFGRA